MGHPWNLALLLLWVVALSAEQSPVQAIQLRHAVIEIVATPSVGDGHLATSVPLGNVVDIEIADDGSIYFVDAGYARVRRIATDGSVHTVFNGIEVSDTLGVDSTPVAISLGAGGDLYVADSAAHRVWVVRPDGSYRVFAGTGAGGLSGDGGDPTRATLRLPMDVHAAPDGVVYIADTNNHRIRGVRDGVIFSALGDEGDIISLEEAWDSASLVLPVRVLSEPSGELLVVDRDGTRLIRWNVSNKNSVREGIPFDGRTVDAVFSTPDVTVVSDGNVRRLGPAGWEEVSPGRSVSIASYHPVFGVVAYHYGDRQMFRYIPGQVEATTAVAGNGTIARFGEDGPVDAATFGCHDLTSDREGRIFFSDPLNRRVAVIEPDGTLKTVIRSGDITAEGDTVVFPLGLTLSSTGMLYIADMDGNQLLRIDSTVTDSKTLRTVVPAGAPSSTDDSRLGPPRLNRPSDVSILADGSLLVRDTSERRILKIVPSESGTSVSTAFVDSRGFASLGNGSAVADGSGQWKMISDEQPGASVSSAQLAAVQAQCDCSPDEILFDGDRDELLLRDKATLRTFNLAGQQTGSVELRELRTVVSTTIGARGEVLFCDQAGRILKLSQRPPVDLIEGTSE